MPDAILFRVQKVDLPVPEEDLPGPTRFKVACSQCGQVVRERREVIKDGCRFCKPCAEKVYFNDAQDITWPDMNWVPKQNLVRKSL